MTLYFADHFVLPLPPGHRFPMAKYARLREALAAGGEFRDEDFRVPAAAGDAEILRAHCPDYLGRVCAGTLTAGEARAIGFPWSHQMVELFAIYLAGADPHEDDRLGRLKLTRDGHAARDEFVLQRLSASGIPVAIAMAGGYGRDLETTVAIHATTILTARRIHG